MSLADLRVLDRWAKEGDPAEITPDVLSQLRACGRLVGIPQGFFDDVSKQNFAQKVQVIRQRKKAASNSLGAALLSSREYEDTGDIQSAIDAFEQFIAANSAEGYKMIAAAEIARLERLQPRQKP